MARKGETGKLVAALAAGRSLQEATAASGLSMSSVQRRRREPDVQAAIEEARLDMTHATVVRYQSLREKALERLDSLLDPDTDPKYSLRAAEITLRHATDADTVRLHKKTLDLEQRLDDDDRRRAADEGGLDAWRS
jgi:hypothetical protein